MARRTKKRGPMKASTKKKISASLKKFWRSVDKCKPAKKKKATKRKATKRKAAKRKPAKRKKSRR